MKLPEIKLGQASRANTVAPSLAAAPHLSKMSAINEGLNTAFNVTQDYKKRKDEASAIAEHTRYVEEVGRVEVAIAGLGDEVSREELLILGADETNQGIEWFDGDTPKQTFKRHEVEAALLSQVLESKTMAAAERMPESKREAWLADTKQRNAQYLVSVSKRNAGEAKTAREREALATAEAIETPEALLAFAQTSPDLDPVKAEQLKNKAQAQIFHRDNHNVINNGSDEELEAALEQIKDPEYRASSGMSETDLYTATARLKAEKGRRDAEDDRYHLLSDKARNEAAQEAVSGINAALKASVPIPDEEWDSAQAAVKGTKFEDQIAIARKGQGFLLMDAETQKEMLASSYNFDDASEHDYFKKAHAQLKANLDKDGFATAVAQGIIADPAPMDLADPDWGNERQRQAELASIHYGRPISPFTQAEVATISASIPNMAARDQVRLAMSFKDMPQVWEQFDVAGENVFAQVGGIGDPDIAAEALAGQKRINDKDFIAPTRADLVSLSQDYLGSAYGPEDKKRVIDTALAIYANNYPLGDGGVVDQEGWKESLQKAGGFAVEINGSKVIAARDLQDPEMLEDFASDFEMEHLKMFGSVPGYTDAQALQMVQDGEWVSVGEGKYNVIYGGGYLPGEDGKYTITFNHGVQQYLAADQAARKRSGINLAPRMKRGR